MIAPRLALLTCLLACSSSGDPIDSGSDHMPSSSQWWFTCGDPVCRGHTPRTGVAACTTEKEGAACQTDGAQCDPMDVCNRLLVCAGKDPRLGPGGCPIATTGFTR